MSLSQGNSDFLAKCQGNSDFMKMSGKIIFCQGKSLKYQKKSRLFCLKRPVFHYDFKGEKILHPREGGGKFFAY